MALPAGIIELVTSPCAAAHSQLSHSLPRVVPVNAEITRVISRPQIIPPPWDREMIDTRARGGYSPQKGVFEALRLSWIVRFTIVFATY
jgi:hypothetical protein